jgi:hypothetical protein
VVEDTHAHDRADLAQPVGSLDVLPDLAFA